MFNKIIGFIRSFFIPQKRDAKKKYDHAVLPHYSAIKWYKCNKCGKEFRRSWGYALEVPPFCTGRIRWIYLCNTCCTSLDMAHAYGYNGEYMPPKPPPPPPPPPPRPRNREYV